jgi:hypothetical protein
LLFSAVFSFHFGALNMFNDSHVFFMIKFLKSLNFEYSNFSRLVKFIFSLSAFGVLLFVFCCSFSDVYLSVGSFFIFLSVSFCLFFPFRFSLFMLFSVSFFVFLYLYFIVYLIRFSFYLWGF